MLANYGYKDGSGDFFIVIDTERCTACGDCIPACPAGVLELIDDEFEVSSDKQVAAVVEAHRKKIKYSCAPCKPAAGYEKGTLPCVRACEPDAIDHSW
ncbi:MAG: 4Fe-4S dicluster domain-containing protein [Planctomycetota bacterium]